MKLLITGHSGFVGTNLGRAFGPDYDLYGLDIPQRDGDLHGSDPASFSGIPPEKIFSWDGMDALPTVDAVIHLAGKAHDTKNVSDPDEYFTVNLGLTKRIFDWFMASGATTFIFFSSVKAVADTVAGDALTEEADPNPQTPYGQSKLAAEQYIREALSAGQGGTGPARDSIKGRLVLAGLGLSQDGPDPPQPATRNPSVFILRPCMIHGPGNKGNLNLLYKVVQKGLPWPLGTFDNQRSFVSIYNVAYVVRQLLEKDIPSGIYNLADDTPLSTNELIRLMATSLGRKPRIWQLPAGLIRTAARAGDLMHLPLNSERLKKLTESYVVSNAKLKQALGINGMPTPAEQGMKQTLIGFTQRRQGISPENANK